MAMNELQLQQLQRNVSVVIIEQPMTRVRFRYATEGEKAGNIYGVSSNNMRQTFPAVMVSFTFCIGLVSLIVISIHGKGLGP